MARRLSDAYAPALLRRGGRVVIDNSAAFRLQRWRAADRSGCQSGRHGEERATHCFRSETARLSFCAARFAAGSRRCRSGRSVRVATYQAASGAGRAGLEELDAAERALVPGRRRTAGAESISAIPLRATSFRRLGSFETSPDIRAKNAKSAMRRGRFSACPNLFVSATAVRVPVSYRTRRSGVRRNRAGRRVVKRWHAAFAASRRTRVPQ